MFGSGIAFSQGVEEGSLGEVTAYYYYLYCTNLHSSNAARPLKMLVFDRTRPFSLYSGILQSSPHIQPFFDNVAY
jgi:hypothetical protein